MLPRSLDRIAYRPTMRPTMVPYGDSALWLTLIGAADPAATVRSKHQPGRRRVSDVGQRCPWRCRSVLRRPTTPAPSWGRPVPAAAAAPERCTGSRPSKRRARVRTDPALYEDPPLDLLMPPPESTGEVLSSGALEQNARLLEGVLGRVRHPRRDHRRASRPRRDALRAGTGTRHQIEPRDRLGG